MWLIYLIILFRTEISISSFSPDTSDFDAYGLKIAANDVLFVEANGAGTKFVIQFAPYNYTFGSLQCSISYDDSTHYVYSVGVGIKQSTTLNPYFYYAGEVVPGSSSTTDQTGHNGTFVGVWINQDPESVQQYSAMQQTLSCNYFTSQQLQFLSSYGHQEFYVIAVEPYGQYAIGLATDFAFTYQPYPVASITTKSGAAVWPNSSTFNPCAADASQTFTIVAGFVGGSAGSRIRATPTVYLIWNNNLTVLSTWSYTATDSSWQSHLTYSGADSSSTKFTMSVKINSDDPTRVLVGMPFLNTVFLFVVSSNGTNLTLASSIDNGQSVGFGKSVAWLTTSQAAILVSTYSLDYVTWYSSNIYLYTSLNDTSLPASPSAVFPNSQQPMPSTINSQLIRIISTPESLAVLDIVGGVILILAEQPGAYASTDTSNSPIAAAMPVVSHSTTCILGTYKSDTGVQPCTLCPSGTRNQGSTSSTSNQSSTSSTGNQSGIGGPSNQGGISGSSNQGDTGATSCISCSSTSFCPLGAVYELNSSVLTSVSQAVAYPRSPDLTVFEDLLINNMFSLGTTPHCIVVSPIFWTLILLIPIFFILIGMASLNWCVQQPKRDQWRNIIKNIFERTDLVGEGELWIGGLASIIILLMTAMAYAFAMSYLNQYPAEKVGPSNFACDTTIRNAQFESSLQALAVPISDEEQPIFDLLNEQNFTLRLDFLNTAASCMTLSISEITSTSTTSLTLASCSNVNGTLSATVFLPQHDIELKVIIDDIQVVGGVRMGLSGPGQLNDSYTLQELNFLQSFYSQSSGTLAQTATIDMALTKAVNETEPLSGSNSEFGGIWYPTFTYSLTEMFITSDSYIMSANLTSITLTIDISETTYYIKNVQSPIAKQPEIIFRTLLFSFLCLEICAIVFVVCKLLLIPLYRKIYTLMSGPRINNVAPDLEMKPNRD